MERLWCASTCPGKRCRCCNSPGNSGGGSVCAGSASMKLGDSPQPMAKSPYLTAPLKTDKMPPGIPYIVGNEAAERFSYYGMNGILVIFMTKYLMDRQGQPDHMSEVKAEQWY